VTVHKTLLGGKSHGTQVNVKPGQEWVYATGTYRLRTIHPHHSLPVLGFYVASTLSEDDALALIWRVVIGSLAVV
jgi:hypothetical protein